VTSRRRVALPLLLRATHVAAAIMAAGCASMSPNAKLEIKVAVSHSAVPSGDTLSIRIVARNPTDARIPLPGGPCGPLGYRVYDLKGIRIAPRPDERCGFIDRPPPRALQPGDSTHITLRWAALRNYGVAAAPESLPPGRYRVVGGLYGEPELRFPSTPTFVDVTR
jgi:hypothetical protein